MHVNISEQIPNGFDTVLNFSPPALKKEEKKTLQYKWTDSILLKQIRCDLERDFYWMTDTRSWKDIHD